MTADFTSQLQRLIDRLAAGDGSARDELIGRAYERLRRLAHVMRWQPEAVRGGIGTWALARSPICEL
jgi:hypothetical protein